MRKLVLALALVACEGTPQLGHDDSGFTPIGQVDAAPDVGATDLGPPDGGVSTEPLRLAFEPVEHDANALRLTDIAFLPGAGGELLVTDKDGEVIHLKLEEGRMRRLGGFRIDDTWPDSDAGVVAVVADPGYAENGFIYVGVSTSQETNVVRRYRLVPGDPAATVASAVTIVEVTGPRAPRSWHNVGSIGFTEQGYLWALFGDKVLEEPAQDLASPLGALLRVIPSRDPAVGGYTVPPDNPYADGTGHPAVYAKGLRSPWKGFYRDGRWWIGDTGQDTIEELNLVDAPGVNLGWPVVEGTCPDVCEGMTDPISHYDHTSGHRFVREDPEARPSRLRVIGVGLIYSPVRADPYAGRWNGVLTYFEPFTGFVRARHPERGGQDWHAGHLHYATGWAQGPDGHVYVTALGTWPVNAPDEVPSPIYRAVLAD